MASIQQTDNLLHNGRGSQSRTGYSPALTPRHHLFIAGTGRAGTSFLVRYLAELGLDTHIARNGTNGWHEKASAGLEDLPIPDRSEQLPYVVKSPWLSECIDSVLADPSIHIDAVLLPVRSLTEAATSRAVLERQAMHAHAPALSQQGRPWQTHGITAGGMVFSLDPVDQARLLAVGFHNLVQRLVQAGVPIVFLDFPRITQDWRYLLAQIRPYLPASVDENAARAAHRRIANLALVRTADEILAEAGTAIPSKPSTAPTDTMVDNIALRREVAALQAELAVIRRDAAEAARALTEAQGEFDSFKHNLIASEDALSVALAELDRVRDLLALSENRIAAVHSSTSWRTTAPLRAVHGVMARWMRLWAGRGDIGLTGIAKRT